jgi:hypothetical protein
MGGEVPITEPEPRVLTISGDHGEGGEGFVRDTPTGLRAGEAGKRVHHRIEVGADAKAPQVEVVGGIDDDREIARSTVPGEGGLQTRRELRAADATSESYNLQRFLSGGFMRSSWYLGTASGSTNSECMYKPRYQGPACLQAPNRVVPPSSAT